MTAPRAYEFYDLNDGLDTRHKNLLSGLDIAPKNLLAGPEITPKNLLAKIKMNAVQRKHSNDLVAEVLSPRTAISMASCGCTRKTE